MFLHRARRRQLASLLVGVLLLAQWLVAAHACMPVHATGPAQAVLHTPQAAVHCHGADVADGADVSDGLGASARERGVCQAHCTADGQAPATAASADLPAAALGWCLVAAPLQVPPAVTVAARAAPMRAGVPPGWPPLYLLHGVLRN